MVNYDEFDEQHHPRTGPSDFAQIIHRAVNRRGFIKGAAALGVAPFVASAGCSSSSPPSDTTTPPAPTPEELLGFSSVPASTEDTVSLPTGYSWKALISWADPINRAGNAFVSAQGFSSVDQANALGDNNDGMQFYALDNEHALLLVNNEYIAQWAYYGGNSAATADDISKAQLGHGVSVLSLLKSGDQWQLDLDGVNTRRITAQSPMQFSGPAAGHDLLTTRDDPSGNNSLGTWANCGCSKTPWGTYLTCEENFNAYFGSSDKALAITAQQQRYGLGVEDWGLQWYRHEDRFDLSKEPQEAHRMGWVVEIDPMDPGATPVKHTALGRFKHENAEIAFAKSGQVVVYMGDDERGEYIYRFVSDGVYREGDHTNNRRLLESGQLYAARFDASEDKAALKGKGRWLKLAIGEHNIGPDTGFGDQAAVNVFARMAASTAGATTMDRPEWVASHPHKAEIYCALTNNSDRGLDANAGGVDMPIGGPNPREANLYGQILRWRPSGQDHGADTFDWDLFALAGNPIVHSEGLAAGSDNVDAGNMFHAPDGLAIDPRGALWIQTDGNFSNAGEYAGMGNNQMLAADPDSGEIRRFMVGPKGCEITGLCWSDDGESMFVGIQHPGDHNSGSNFPGGEGTLPRSTVIVVRRDEGGVIGG